MWNLTRALTEEIGDPDLFVGRKKEMARLLDRAAVLDMISRSDKGDAAEGNTYTFERDWQDGLPGQYLLAR